MAEIIWTEPALSDLDAVADYIALDKPEAARRLVHRVFEHVEQLVIHPKSGSVPPELRGSRYRQIVRAPLPRVLSLRRRAGLDSSRNPRREAIASRPPSPARPQNSIRLAVDYRETSSHPGYPNVLPSHIPLEPKSPFPFQKFISIQPTNLCVGDHRIRALSTPC